MQADAIIIQKAPADVQITNGGSVRFEKKS